MLTTLQAFHLRPALPRDLNAIAHLERESFEEPYAFEYFADVLHDPQRHVYVHVAPSQEAIEAFIVWQFTSTQILIEDLAVRPAARKQGLATRTLEWLCSRNAADKTMLATVSERNLAAQLLLQKVGFLCVKLDRELYREWSDDLALTFRLTPPRAIALGLAHPTKVTHASR